jgi:hypothetical protein
LIHRLQLRLFRQPLEQRAPQAHDRRGTARRAIQAPKQLLPRRLGGMRQPHQLFGTGLPRIGLRAREHRLRVGAEVARQVVEETRAAIVGQRIEAPDDAQRDRRPVGLAAFGQQAPALGQQAAQRMVLAQALGLGFQFSQHDGSAQKL